MKKTGVSMIICTILLFSIAGIPVVAGEDMIQSSTGSSRESGPDYLHGLRVTTPESLGISSVINKEPSGSIETGLELSSLQGSPADTSGIEWQLQSGGSYGDILYDIQPLEEGGYIAVGATASRDRDITAGGSGSSDAWVVKISDEGKIEWQRLYGGNGYDSGMSVRQTSDKGYVFTGSTASTDGDFSGNHGGDDVWIAKLNQNGEKQWQILMGGSNDDNGYSVRELSDGYIVAGDTVSKDIETSGNDIGGIYAAKVYSDGTFAWQKAFGGSGDDYGSSIIPALDGGYILAGYSNSADFGSGQRKGYEDVIVMKIAESDGKLVWLKVLGGIGYDRTGYDNVISPTTDGGYILTAQSTSGDLALIHGSFDTLVVKLNQDGSIQSQQTEKWQKLFGGTLCEVIGSITPLSDGGYILTSQAGSSQSGDVVEENYGQHDIWVLRLDADGNIVWQKLMGGNRWDQSTSIRETKDGGYIFAGFTQSSNSGYIGTNRGYEDAWVVKLNPRLTVDVIDSDSNPKKPVYGAKVFLYDETNDEEQSMIAVNGHAAFADSGETHQYRLVKGNKYSVKVTADEYFGSYPVEVTYSGDGQRVIVELTPNKRPIPKTFSMTNTIYQDKKPTLASTYVTKAVMDRLNSAGWGDPVYSEQGPAVTRGFFGGISQEPTPHSLNDVTLHYHVGHGPFMDSEGNTAISLLKNTEIQKPGQYDGDDFKATDVVNKWGGKNKWVILHTCNTLKDTKWKTAMGTTHGVFGFATVSDDNNKVPDYFLSNALEGNTLYNSWRDATGDALWNLPAPTHFNEDGTLDYSHDTVDMVAVAYFKTSKQKSTDHLPDKGDIAPEGGTGDEVIHSAWNCRTNDEVTL